jgi:hypothetical protein
MICYNCLDPSRQYWDDMVLVRRNKCEKFAGGFADRAAYEHLPLSTIPCKIAALAGFR